MEKLITPHVCNGPTTILEADATVRIPQSTADYLYVSVTTFADRLLNSDLLLIIINGNMQQNRAECMYFFGAAGLARCFHFERPLHKAQIVLAFAR